MLNTFPAAVAVGTVLGFLSGLGVGGGSLLILWLTLVISMDPATARMINLMFFLPCSAVSVWFRRNQGVVEIKKLLPAMITGCVFAGLFSWLGGWMDIGLLRKLFGGLLIAVGFRELTYRPRKFR